MIITYCNNCVQSIFSSVLHIVTKHDDDLLQIKFTRSTEFEKECIIMPWVMCNILVLYPLLESCENFFLFI